jgi:hypothetical protein
MLKQSTLQWLGMALTKDLYDLSALPSDWLNKAINLIDGDLAAFEDYAAPADKPTIIRTLGALASMLQTPLPDETGLDLYVLALAKMPAPVFNAARNKLVLSHRWPRLPLPADFIEAGKEDQAIIDTMRSVLGSARLKAERALARQLRA